MRGTIALILAAAAFAGPAPAATTEDEQRIALLRQKQSLLNEQIGQLQLNMLVSRVEREAAARNRQRTLRATVAALGKPVTSTASAY